MRGNIHVGTSGWHYEHWRGEFYPPDMRAGEFLAFYAAHFDIVELNNTFYRLPPEAAVENWRDSSPAGFRFAVKGSRFLTHMKKLKDAEPGLERFFAHVDPLGAKMGPVLFQLPPRWGVSEERLADFLGALPKGHRYAFEFRDESWNIPPVENLLRKHQAAYCIFDLAGKQSPLAITADFTYVRLHGPGGKYQGIYSPAALESWAKKLREWDLGEAYVFFDNDPAGFAVKNAKQLKEMLS